MAERFRLPRTITASSWPNIWGGVWARAQQVRGTVRDSQGTVAPKLTNREALAIVTGMRIIPTREPFDFWAQFAAIAYGWDPPKRDRLDTSAAQADRFYPPDQTVSLVLEMQRLLAEVDASPGQEPRIDLDKDDFDDPLVQGDVAAQIAQDGGLAVRGIPIPTGKCVEKGTGKKRPIRPKCDKDGLGPREPATGKRLECDKEGDCEPEIIDVDPLREVFKVTVVIALVALAALALKDWAVSPRRR
jgi:hypothetical protein